MTSELTCVGGCGRFAAGRCTSCCEPVCSVCSPGPTRLLCPTDRAVAHAVAEERRADDERQRAATPQARAARASELAAQQAWAFKEQMRANGWNFRPFERSTIDYLSSVLPALVQHAAEAAEPVSIVRSFGRNEQRRGWVFGCYTQEPGSDPGDPSPTPLFYVVCDDGTVRVADRSAGALRVPKYRGALYLDTGSLRSGTLHHDQEGLLLFGNTKAIRWTIRELLGEGKLADLILAASDGGKD